ncbi:hypothetical protein HY570_02345 [Candidatus Micrarchaeota archaeon]|nr:hypothetical protein [Candidatus Micrarchaeota archaeon]
MNKLLIIGILVVLAVVIYLGISIKQEITEAQATKFVLDDLSSKYQGAKIGILTIEKNETSDWNIKAWVTYSADSPCPNRKHVYYNYPKFNFVTREESITPECKVCEGSRECIIVFPEEAIIASHVKQGTEGTNAYLKNYPDAKAAAVFNPPENEGYTDAWLVTWTSEKTNVTQYVLLNKFGGTVIREWSMERSTAQG